MIAPRVMREMPMAEYLALEAVSSSALRDLGRSPKYTAWRVDQPDRQTPAMALGSAVDCLLLEPREWQRRYTVKDYDARTKAGKQRRDDLAQQGITVLSRDDTDRAFAIVESVRGNLEWQAVESCGIWAQMTVVWPEADGRLHAKARPDVVTSRGGYLLDLKVTRDAVPASRYERRHLSLWHPQQLAWYARGLKECGLSITRRGILAVSSEPPHECCLYWHAPDLCAWADRAVERRLQHYIECWETGSWTGGPDAAEIGLPAYIRDDEDEIEIDGDVAVIEEEDA